MKVIKHVFIPILFFISGVVSVFVLLYKLFRCLDANTVFKDWIIETLDLMFFGKPRHPRTPTANTGYRPNYRAYTTYYKEDGDDVQRKN